MHAVTCFPSRGAHRSCRASCVRRHSCICSCLSHAHRSIQVAVPLTGHEAVAAAEVYDRHLLHQMISWLSAIRTRMPLQLSTQKHVQALEEGAGGAPGGPADGDRLRKVTTTDHLHRNTAVCPLPPASATTSMEEAWQPPVRGEGRLRHSSSCPVRRVVPTSPSSLVAEGEEDESSASSSVQVSGVAKETDRVQGLVGCFVLSQNYCSLQCGSNFAGCSA
jgi:hypothetical protein